MSIADEEQQINRILSQSKNRLKTVEETLSLLTQEKSSIEEDISILTQRAEMIKARVQEKKIVLQNVNSMTVDAEQAYRKLKQSTKLLLSTIKKECKKIDEAINQQQHPNQE